MINRSLLTALLALTAGTLILPFALGPVVNGTIGSDPTAPQPLRWQDALGIVSQIHALPPWPARDMNAEEQKAYLSLARELQQHDSETLYAALIAYMVDCANEDRVIGDGSWAKPMLLLRIMFDLPNDDLSNEDVDRLAASGIQVCGGFLYRPLDTNFRASIAAPIVWRDDRFCLTAAYFGVPEPHGAGSYQPHLELKVFRSRYAMRNLALPVKGS